MRAQKQNHCTTQFLQSIRIYKKLGRDNYQVAVRVCKLESRVAEFQNGAIGDPVQDANDPAYFKKSP